MFFPISSSSSQIGDHPPNLFFFFADRRPPPSPYMAMVENKSATDNSGNKVWGFFRLPFKPTATNPTSSSSSSASQLHQHHSQYNNNAMEGSNHHQQQGQGQGQGQGQAPPNSVSSVARSLLPTRRRLKLDPASKLYFLVS
ncbi:Vesicle-associated protein 4-2 [Linum perenne]